MGKVEPKKEYAFDCSCTGIGCPRADSCPLTMIKDQAKYRTRPVFQQRKDGFFCEELQKFYQKYQ